jgi:hypothetical protein
MQLFYELYECGKLSIRNIRCDLEGIEDLQKIYYLVPPDGGNAYNFQVVRYGKIKVTKIGCILDVRMILNY